MSSPGPMLNGISWIDLVCGRGGSGPPGTGVRVAQRAVWPIRRRPRRGARRGRPGTAVGWRAQRRPGDAARDVDEQAAAGPSAGRARPSRDPPRGPGSTSPPWAPTPGTRNARPGRERRGSRRAPRVPSRRRRGRRCRPVPRPRPGARRAPTAARRARRSRRRRRRRGPGAPRRRGWTSGTARRRSGPARSRSGAIASSPRYGLTVTASAPEHVEQRDRLAGGRGADVAALGVGDERDVRRDQRAQPLERGDPRRPVRLEEGEVRLHRGGVRERRLDDQAGEALDAVERRPGSPSGSAVGVGVDAHAQDRARRRGPRAEPVEVRGHEGDGESAGAVDGGRQVRRAARTSPGARRRRGPAAVVRSSVSLTVQLGPCPRAGPCAGR